MSKVIQLYCESCRRYLHIDYHVTGDGNTIVLPNQSVKCVSSHCKHVLPQKEYTEWMLLDDIHNGKFYM